MERKVLEIEKEMEFDAMILVGAKSDRSDRRVVSQSHGEYHARKWNVRFHETSSFTGSGVDDLFHDVVVTATQQLGYQSDKYRRHVTGSKESRLDWMKRFFRSY